MTEQTKFGTLHTFTSTALTTVQADQIINATLAAYYNSIFTELVVAQLSDLYHNQMYITGMIDHVTPSTSDRSSEALSEVSQAQTSDVFAGVSPAAMLVSNSATPTKEAAICNV